MKNKTKWKLVLFVVIALAAINIYLYGVRADVSINPFDSKKIVEKAITSDMPDFIKEDFNIKYGVIRISNTFLWIETDKIVEYSLTYNTDKCYEDCEARGKAVLYKDGTLFDDIIFKDVRTGISKTLNYNFLLKTEENYTEDVPVYKKDCKIDSKNSSDDCKYVLDHTDKITKTRDVWKEYIKGDPLKAGDYEWKLIGRKNKDVSIDWIATARTKELSEWITWTVADCKATGGNITIITDTCIHTFTTNGTFAIPSGSMNLTVLIVAGGGGGGGGGGGAGGLIYNQSYTSSGSSTVIVGVGGLGGATNSKRGFNGTNSSFGDLQAMGGGGGGAPDAAAGAPSPLNEFYGANGGSGGGNGGYAAAETSMWGGNGTAGQGYAGGTYYPDYRPMAGGGGSSQNGTRAVNTTITGSGGNGTLINITGTPTYYAGGGGGGCYDASCAIAGKGGLGGGGNGSIGGTATNGVNLTGSGGGGGRGGAAGRFGGAGGTGIVIIQYKIVTDVELDLNSPLNNSIFSDPNINFNCTAKSNSTSILNLTLEFPVGVYNYTVYNVSANQNLSFSKDYTLAEGRYNYSCNAYDIIGKQKSGDVYFFAVDLSPPKIDILYPISNSEIQTLTSATNLTLNVSIIETGNLSVCSYFNGTANTTITCNNNASIKLLNEGNYTFCYYANDSINNFGSNCTTFSLNYLRLNYTYPSPAIEGETNPYCLNFNSTLNSNVTGNFTYNGTMMNYSSYGKNMSICLNATSNYFNTNTIVYFYFNYTVNGVRYNSPLINHTVFDIPNLVVDSAPCSNLSLNLTVYDEENFSIINYSEINYNFKYGFSNSTLLEAYGSFTGVSSIYVCINTTVSPNLSLGYGEIAYNAPGYADRRYYFFNNTILTTTVQNVPLYDILSSRQTSFKLEVESTSLTPYTNKFTKLIRWYPDVNEYRTVDMGLTDETGSTVIHVRTEDVDYRIGVYERDGTLIKLANPIRMVCLISPCTYTLKISPSETDYTSFLNIQYQFTFNRTTNIWTFIYSDPSGDTNSMNLTVFKDTGISSYAVCSNSVVGAVGAITCNTSLYTGTLRGEVYRSASPIVPIVQKIVNVGTSAFNSSYGLWITLLIAIPIVLIFAFMSPILAIIGGVVALIPAMFLGSINFAIVGGIAVLGGIVLHFLKRIG